MRKRRLFAFFIKLPQNRQDRARKIVFGRVRSNFSGSSGEISAAYRRHAAMENSPRSNARPICGKLSITRISHILLQDVVVHHIAAADVRDDRIDLIKAEMAVHLDRVRVALVDREVDPVEPLGPAALRDKTERRARQTLGRGAPSRRTAC